MSITQEQIHNLVGNLSKLSLKNEEKLLDDVNNILKYVEMLNEINTSGVNPTVSVIDSNLKTRKDERETKSEPSELLKCSNQKIIGNQIAISSIMK